MVLYSNELFYSDLFCIGIDSETKRLDSNITQSDLLQCIDQLNNDKSVDGILVQLPVPAHIDERTICNAVDPDKDVDGFNNSNIGKLCLNVDTFIPCTALGVIELIKRYKPSVYMYRRIL